MSELVLLHHNEPMTTSLAIAEGVELQHKNVLELIRKHLINIADFGEVAFQTRLNPQGSPTEFVFLNEGQSMFLMTLMRNSEIVVAFKKELVKAFLSLRDRVKSIQPTFTTTNLNHGADLAVAADRTFRSFLRAARSAGLRMPQALQVANRQTVVRTGIDMLSELGVETFAPGEQHDALSVVETSTDRFLSSWLLNNTRFPRIPCRSSDLFRAYRKWCAESNEIAVPDVEFYRHSAKLPGLRKLVALVEGRSMRIVIPDCETPPDGWSISRWAARCVAEFSTAI